ncbi:Group 1 truncated hemoglobin GlbN [Diplonema papillatum]|nr:Group 1 truncated hemoglobin GlbN [Diplonema papillatum]
MATLLDRLGGDPAVEEAAERFYDKAVANRVIGPFFVGVDVSRLVHKQHVFLLPALVKGLRHNVKVSLRAAHRPFVERMGLNDTHFDTFVALFCETLTELGSRPEDVAEVAAVLDSYRRDVVCTALRPEPRISCSLVGAGVLAGVALVLFARRASKGTFPA